MGDPRSDAYVAVLMGEARHAVSHAHSLLNGIRAEHHKLLSQADQLLAREAELRLTQALSALVRMDILRLGPELEDLDLGG